jgi:hypothetical protein
MKLWLNICFYYTEERLHNFYKVIKNLINVPHIKLIINSNINFDLNLPIYTANLKDPYMHTWEHKKYMLEFLKSDYTHFGYLEGNIEIKKKTIDYWVATRELFKKNNLNFIPAVHRIQKRGNEIFSLDCAHHQDGRPIIEVSGQKFISLSEPYQGMFIMDKELVEEHIKSDYFSAGLKKSFLIKESANLGNMFVNIPKGFSYLAAPYKGKGIRRRDYGPKPFFIPSYLEGIQKYPKELLKVLEVQTRKYNAKK